VVAQHRSLFEEKAARIMALYRTCPADGVVVSFDEFGPISLQPYPAIVTPSASDRDDSEPPTCDAVAVGYFFGAYDVHADVHFGSYRLAKMTNEVLVFYKQIRRRFADHLRVYLVNDNLSLHWTPLIRACGFRDVDDPQGLSLPSLEHLEVGVATNSTLCVAAPKWHSMRLK
jgi:hypothetical protein